MSTSVLSKGEENVFLIWVGGGLTAYPGPRAGSKFPAFFKRLAFYNGKLRGHLGIPPDDKEEDSFKKSDAQNKKKKKNSLESTLFLSKSGNTIKMKSLS